MWAWRERQRCLVLHIPQSKGCSATSFLSECVHRRYSRNGKWHAHCHILKMSINRAATIFGIASWKIQRAAWQHWLIIKISSAFLGKNGCDNIPTMSYKWASTECQRLVAWHHGRSNGCAATLSHNRTNGSLSTQKRFRGHRHYTLIMSGTGASTFQGPALSNIKRLCNHIYP